MLQRVTITYMSIPFAAVSYRIVSFLAFLALVVCFVVILVWQVQKASSELMPSIELECSPYAENAFT